ncbi:MAG: thioredoxin domain-containing protein [Candidatus Eisenbacteria bacterium]|nr:thioredoxin domain-containing protein [Candidatus Eisenbacteria bacterium]
MSPPPRPPSDHATPELPVNRLSGERSPYLLQHATNPVDWYPWGEEAFARARADDKPIFLSIGYSTCHWCHVMAHESFEDEEVAALLNDAFVCIKVDREERPDIDSIYMAACQAMTRGGGWPLSIFMTADKVPFYATTYLPPRARYGRAGLVELVPRIRGVWDTDRAALHDVGEQMAKTLARTPRSGGPPLERAVIEEAFWELSRRFDERHGGFGNAPKFPTPHTLMFLLRYWRRSGNPRALTMVEQTLTAMRRGGMYDHVGFGFHRYSTDARWLVPHFEKMLYDQALLIMAYTEAFQATGNSLFSDTAREIIAYVLRDLLLPEGAFASAEDADSEGEEGAFYLWTEEEIRAVVPHDDVPFVLQAFEVRPEGNFSAEAGGTAERRNILHRARPLAEVGVASGISEGEAASRLEAARAALLTARTIRVRPQRDDKILADWNGLMIAALAKAAAALGEPLYADAARRAAEFILTSMRAADGRLLHRWRDGDVAIHGFADDYAFLGWGLLELYEATFDTAFLTAALELTERLVDRFGDPRGGFFFTSDDAETIIMRTKDVYDGAIPSANSVALGNLVRLGRMTGDGRWEAHARTLASAVAARVGAAPSAHTLLLMGLDHLLGPATEIVIVGTPGADDTNALVGAVRGLFLPATVVTLAGEGFHRASPLPGIGSAPADGRATAYVCRGETCLNPTSDPRALIEALRAGPHA